MHGLVLASNEAMIVTITSLALVLKHMGWSVEVPKVNTRFSLVDFVYPFPDLFQDSRKLLVLASDCDQAVVDITVLSYTMVGGSWHMTYTYPGALQVGLSYKSESTSAVMLGACLVSNMIVTFFMVSALGVLERFGILL